MRHGTARQRKRVPSVPLTADIQVTAQSSSDLPCPYLEGLSHVMWVINSLSKPAPGHLQDMPSLEFKLRMLADCTVTRAPLRHAYLHSVLHTQGR